MDQNLSVTVRRAGANESNTITKLFDESVSSETTKMITQCPADVTDLQGEFFVLDNDSGELIGAIHVDVSEQQGQVGLLTVAPEYAHKDDVKRRLVAVAEAYCEAQGCESVEIKVIAQRQHLSGWYRSLGYEECGTTQSYQPQLSAHGTATWIRMEKNLAA